MRAFQPADTAAVVQLWRDCGLLRPWNDPLRDIARKQGEQPALFRVAVAARHVANPQVVGTAMTGYDGHRGWLYYLAVAPTHQRQGIARRLVADAEAMLLARGCPKLEAMVRDGNAAALAFWRACGYAPDAVTTLGRRLIAD